MNWSPGLSEKGPVEAAGLWKTQGVSNNPWIRFAAPQPLLLLVSSVLRPLLFSVDTETGIDQPKLPETSQFHRKEVEMRARRSLTEVLAVSFVLVVFGVAGAQGPPREGVPLSPGGTKMHFSRNECLSKGGIGIISENIYINLRAEKNTILLNGNEWTGKGKTVPQVVLLQNGRVWSFEEEHNGFTLGKSVLVSFEGEKVFFFDFRDESGGFYVRQGLGGKE